MNKTNVALLNQSSLAVLAVGALPVATATLEAVRAEETSAERSQPSGVEADSEAATTHHARARWSSQVSHEPTGFRRTRCSEVSLWILFLSFGSVKASSVGVVSLLIPVFGRLAAGCLNARSRSCHVPRR